MATTEKYKNQYAAAQAKGDKTGTAASNTGTSTARTAQTANKSTSASPVASAGRSSVSNVEVSDKNQQIIKDQMAANSEAWHNATSQEEKDRLHAANQQLADKLNSSDGSVKFDPTTGQWSGQADPGYWIGGEMSNMSGNTGAVSGGGGGSSSGGGKGSSSGGGIEDLSSYLAQMYAAQKEAALAAINNAYQQNVAAIDRAKEKVGPQYQTARNQTAGSSEQSARNFAEYAAASGLGSGTSAQAELARNITLQNNLNQLNSQEAEAYADLELQKSQAEIEYNNAIAQAEASNNSQLAQALYQEKVRVQNGLIQQQQILFEQSLAERQFQFQQQQADISNQQWQSQFDTSIKQWQDQFDYQKQQDALAQENKNNQYLAAWGESMLENGSMPTADMLAAMGLTSDQAQAYIDFYKQQQQLEAQKSGSRSTSSYGGSSSGGSKSAGSGSSSVSLNMGNNSSGSAQNQSYAIDTNSVLQLGYGPIDGDSLAQLEAEGKIESYVDGNKIKFRKVSNQIPTGKTSSISPLLDSLKLIGR